MGEVDELQDQTGASSAAEDVTGQRRRNNRGRRPQREKKAAPGWPGLAQGDRLTSRPGRVKGRIRELEDRSTEMMQTATRARKRE